MRPSCSIARAVATDLAETAEEGDANRVLSHVAPRSAATIFGRRRIERRRRSVRAGSRHWPTSKPSVAHRRLGRHRVGILLSRSRTRSSCASALVERRAPRPSRRARPRARPRRTRGPAQCAATETMPTAPIAMKGSSRRRRRCRGRVGHRAPPCCARRRRRSPEASFMATMFSCERDELDRGRRGDLAPGARRDVVEHDGQLRARRRSRPKWRRDAVLAGSRVGGRRGEDAR